jgi:hypothetical protein
VRVARHLRYPKVTIAITILKARIILEALAHINTSHCSPRNQRQTLQSWFSNQYFHLFQLCCHRIRYRPVLSARFGSDLPQRRLQI